MDFEIEALREAALSPCLKRKVGTVITKGDKIVSRGHNDIHIGICEDAQGRTKPEVIHSEINALYALAHKGAETEGLVAYITHQPCIDCEAALELAGIKYVVVSKFMKFDEGKLRYSLVPTKAVRELAKVVTYGASKYKPNNWQEAEDTSRYVDALYRHLEAWRAGDKVDAESGLSHLSHALTNISFLIHFEEIQD